MINKTNIKFNPITNQPINNNLRESQSNSKINSVPDTLKDNSKNNNNIGNSKINNNKNCTPNPNSNKDNNHNFKNKITCKIHNLEVGGCCENYECISKPQIMCIKCTADQNFCIRQSKHEFIHFDEFVNNFTNREIDTLKNDNQFSKSYSLSKKFLLEEIKIKNEFLEKSRTIQDEINNYYLSVIDFTKNLLDDFNDKFEKFVNTKLNFLMKSYENLNNFLSFEHLCKFEKNQILEKINSVNSYEEANEFIVKMKKTIYNYKKKNCDIDIDNIKYIFDMNVQNENVFMIKKRFEEIKNDLDQKHLSFCNNLDKNIFFSNILSGNNQNSLLRRNNKNDNYNSNNNDYFENSENVGITNLTLFKELKIDYSTNSNFIDKKFLIFEHSNGMTYMAFPTSLNAIKLIDFNTLLKDDYYSISEACNELDNLNNNNSVCDTPIKSQLSNIKNNPIVNNNSNTKDKYFKATHITNKDFNRSEPVDKHLVYQLLSHGGRVTLLKYYLIYFNQDQAKDLLITASEDKTIKIWDITDINKYLEDVNKQYRNLCARTIIAHDNNKISNFVNFYDPIKNKNYIVSSGYGDRIKVWDLASGTINREVADSAIVPNFDNDILVFHENFSSKNYMVTSGHNYCVRVWDFDKGKILKTFSYKEKILDLILLDNNILNGNNKINKNYTYNNNFCLYLPKIFIVDENGKCSSLIFEKDEKNEKNEKNEVNFYLRYEMLNTGDAIRTGGIKWNEKKVFLSCKNGQIYEYEIDDLFEYFNINEGTNNASVLGNVNTFIKESKYDNINGPNKNKLAKFINLGTNAISYCEKYRDLVFGDLLIVHCHDQKLKILKLK